jgi:hypothetical protein
MTDRRHNDTGLKIGAIVDNALSELIVLGMESKDAAAVMMAVQAIVRIDDNEKVKEVAEFAAESVWDFDDTGEEPSK